MTTPKRLPPRLPGEPHCDGDEEAGRNLTDIAPPRAVGDPGAHFVREHDDHDVDESRDGDEYGDEADPLRDRRAYLRVDEARHEGDEDEARLGIEDVGEKTAQHEPRRIDASERFVRLAGLAPG